MMRAALVLTALAAAGCDSFPKDPESTLATARGGVLRVGVTDAPPWLVREGDEARGREAELVRGFASSIGAEVRWTWGPLEDHLHALENFELAIVAGGLRKDSPWAKRLAFTEPYAQDRVLAVPPGENALLVALDRYLAHEAR